jgi:sulfide:quinone oxidoreductase
VKQVLVLGAGFGGLELATRLSESVPDEVRVTLVDQADGFLFGFQKLDVLFRGRAPEEMRLPYRDLALPGVEFRQERVLSIEPRTRRVVTDRGEYQPDVLVVALGADYDPAATPGFVEDGFEFYSVPGAQRLRERLATFDGGEVVLAVLALPFKCPPAPFEAALLLHEHLVATGVRDRSTIEVISPMASPVPVSPSTNEAILTALHERGITYTPGRRVRRLDPAAHVAHLSDEVRRYDLFVGIPTHRVPAVLDESGLTQGGGDGWVAVNPRTLATPYDGVYALGDCADAPVPRAGVFAETAARAVADDIISQVRRTAPAQPYDGKGSCFIEMGDGRVGMVDADFLSGPEPVAPFYGPSLELAQEKRRFEQSRSERWFGRRSGESA